MITLSRLGMASALALAVAAPAGAQTYRETQDSQRARAQYEADRQQYEASREIYSDTREEYREARRDYDRRLADWETARARYDARFGAGAYARYYARPSWNEDYWASTRPSRSEVREARAEVREARADAREARRDYERRMADWETARDRYDRRYGAGAYERRYVRPTWDDAYWSAGDRTASNGSSSDARCNNNSAVAGGVIGAIAGAVLGSNVAARNARTEGAVLGGVLGAAVGAGVGNANDKYKCDQRGPYFTYEETRPYREGRDRYPSSFERSYYDQQGCRLAAAPVDSYGRDVRYVRVCPDENRRYRITS